MGFRCDLAVHGDLTDLGRLGRRLFLDQHRGLSQPLVDAC